LGVKQLGRNGRHKPIPIKDSNFSVACNTAVLALGYWPHPVLSKSTPDLTARDWGLISVVDKSTDAALRPAIDQLLAQNSSS